MGAPVLISTNTTCSSPVASLASSPGALPGSPAVSRSPSFSSPAPGGGRPLG